MESKKEKLERLLKEKKTLESEMTNLGLKMSLLGEKMGVIGNKLAIKEGEIRKVKRGTQ
jgi:hypothetical protein